MESREPAAKLPERIGQYRILRELGRGGMGVVFEAEQENPRRFVALKVLSVGILGTDLRARFEREAQVLGHLQHNAIAKIYEAGVFESTAGAQPFFAMELVRGTTLTDYVKREGLDRRARLELLAAICDGVEHAHQRGVIHRDLKPDNILIDAEGNPKILDFGLARATDADLQVATLHTGVGQIMGTIPYMSPEQTTGDPDAIDGRSDVYSLGVVGYELVAGRMPYDAQGPEVLDNLRVVHESEAAPLGSVHRDLRGDIETIIGKALEKERGRRYASPAELAADIRHHLRNEPITARPPSTLYRMAKFVRRNRPLVIGAAAVFVTLIVGLVGTSRGFLRALEEARNASAEAARSKRTAAFLEAILSSIDPAVAQGSDTTLFKGVLDDTAERIGTELADDPPIEATLRDTMATAYFSIAEFEAGLAQARRALELFESIDGPRAEKTLVVRRKIGSFLLKLGDFEGAETALRATHDDELDVLGVDDPETWHTRAELGIVFLKMNRFEEAAAEFHAALEWCEAFLGPDATQTLVAKNCLGLARLGQHRTEEGAAILEEVLEDRRRVYGEAHPETIKAIHNLAGARNTLQRFDDAEALYRDAIEAYDRVLGPDHDATLEALSNLGALLRDVLRLDEAADLQERVLEITRRIYGPDGPATLTAELALGRTYSGQGRLGEAEPLIRHAFERRKELYGLEHHRTLDAMLSLLTLLDRLGLSDEADPMRERCVELHVQILGEDHRNTIVARHDLAVHHFNQGDFARAEAGLAQAYAAGRRALGETHHQTLRSLLVLARAMERQGHIAESVPLLGEFLDSWSQLYGDEHTFSVQAALQLASSIDEVTELGPCEPALRALHGYHQRTQGPDAPAVLMDEISLGVALQQLGQHDKALEAFEEALARSIDRGPPPRALAAYAESLIAVGRTDEGLETLTMAYETERSTARRKRSAQRLAELSAEAGNEHEAAAWRKIAEE